MVIAMSVSPPPVELTSYELPPSLWLIVENCVPEHEREEVKNMLGEGLVEQSIELHQEAETFLDIWREYREETNCIVQMPKRLPEPPALRERLRQEICFFVEQIREKAERTGTNSCHILSKHKKDVLDYAMEQKRPGSSGYNSRPSTGRSSRNGRETPMLRFDTPTSDRYSLSSARSDEVEKMQDKLNVLKLDEVITHLKETLEEEIETLHGDIKFLQECLEEEADYRANSSMGFVDCEPSLSELKEERNQLEKDLLRHEESVPEVLRDSSVPQVPREKLRNSAKYPPAFRKNSAHVPRPPKQRTPGTESESQVRTRASPMKASHSIGTAQVLTVHRNNSASHKTDSQLHTSGAVLSKGRSLDSQTQDLGNTTAHVSVRTGSAGSVHRSAKVAKFVPKPVVAFEGSDVGQENRKAVSNSRSSSRPSSASRFRKMVMECRDDQDPKSVGDAS